MTIFRNSVTFKRILNFIEAKKFKMSQRIFIAEGHHTSQRGYLWSEYTTVHCVQSPQYLKGHKETICGWKRLASEFFHDDIISKLLRLLFQRCNMVHISYLSKPSAVEAGRGSRRHAVC